MKHQALFSLKDKSTKKIKVFSAAILLGFLRVKRECCYQNVFVILDLCSLLSKPENTHRQNCIKLL